MSLSRTSGRHDVDAEGCCVTCNCHVGTEFGTIRTADGREIKLGERCTKGNPRAETDCPGPAKDA